jgi:hypothetical protein
VMCLAGFRSHGQRRRLWSVDILKEGYTGGGCRCHGNRRPLDGGIIGQGHMSASDWRNMKKIINNE